MAADFDRFRIKIRQNTLDWGPFGFDFEDAMPSGLIITAVTLNSYLGFVKPKEDLAGQVDTTSELIDTGKTSVSGATTINAYFNYPSTPAYLGKQSHTLVFNLTLDSGATHSYYGYYVWAY